MKSLFLTLAVAASLFAGSAFGGSSGTDKDVDLSTLSDAQIDSLISILSGLPRN